MYSGLKSRGKRDEEGEGVIKGSSSKYDNKDTLMIRRRRARWWWMVGNTL